MRFFSPTILLSLVAGLPLTFALSARLKQDAAFEKAVDKNMRLLRSAQSSWGKNNK